MGEILPCISILAVVLADRSPLPFGEVRSPFFPGGIACSRVLQPRGFRWGLDCDGHFCTALPWGHSLALTTRVHGREYGLPVALHIHNDPALCISLVE